MFYQGPIDSVTRRKPSRQPIAIPGGLPVQQPVRGGGYRPPVSGSRPPGGFAGIGGQIGGMFPGPGGQVGGGVPGAFPGGYPGGGTPTRPIGGIGGIGGGGGRPGLPGYPGDGGTDPGAIKMRNKSMIDQWIKMMREGKGQGMTLNDWLLQNRDYIQGNIPRNVAHFGGFTPYRGPGGVSGTQLATRR